jgi:ABC-type Fe3+/spermidine/putrescine transport system ATPase subunit
VAEAGPELTLARVYKRFGSVEALSDVSLSVARGELLTVLGPSGSGKSTLLQTVAGYELPDAGAVVLAGRDVTALSPARRDIGMVFQSYALFPHLSVADNVAFPLEVRGTVRHEIRKRVSWALELVALAGLEQRKPRQLSGGQQQRVALARAIVFRPRLLLLDEPLAALDRKLRDAMQGELKSLQRQLGIATLFITHDQDEALALGDRVAVMRQGRLEQISSPRDIYVRPANRFIAEFVGESNLITGRIERAEASEAALRCGGELIVAADPDRRARTGASATLMLRPEVPQLAGEGPCPRNVLRTTVKERNGVGAADRYRLATAAGLELLWQLPAHPSRAGFAPGEVVEIGWEPGDAHLLVD